MFLDHVTSVGLVERACDLCFFCRASLLVKPVGKWLMVLHLLNGLLKKQKEFMVI